MKIESRNKLWYGKYTYRARFFLAGINRTYNCQTFLQYLKNLEKNIANASDDPWSSHWQARLRTEINNIDLDPIERYIEWRAKHTGKQGTALIRNESNTAAVFSNDLALLQTLQSIEPSLEITYTKVDNNIPQGMKYYTKEPKRKYRVYLRSMHLKDRPTFRTDLTEFIERYYDTKTVMTPSKALHRWLWESAAPWRILYCQEHFYLEYDDPSTYTLISLMFGDMLSAMYKLEKRPV